MKQFFAVFLIIVALFGLGKFSFFAYERVENSRSARLNSELKTAKEEHQKQVNMMTEQVKREVARREKAREMMLAMFPAKQEDITNIFNSLNEPPAEQKAEGAKDGEQVTVAPATETPATEKKEGESR